MPSCYICTQQDAVMHLHHVVPQSAGGKDGPTVDLCSRCHNLLHSHALSVAARVRNNGKTKVRQFWKTSEEEANAQPLLNELVQAILRESRSARPHIVSTTVDTDLYMAFKMLKIDLGLTSLEETLKYCIRFTLSHRGLTCNEQNKQEGISMW